MVGCPCSPLPCPCPPQGDKLYVCGGLVDGHWAHHTSNSKECAYYNPDSNAWSAFEDMLVATNHQPAATDGHKMYILGGRTNTINNPGAGINKLQIYDPATNSVPTSRVVLSLRCHATYTPLAQCRAHMHV